MLRPPSIRHALRFPATAGTLILSLAATIPFWAHVDCSALLADAHLARGQFHRLVTAALLHRDPIHLAFNFFWLWTFGTLIERHVGSLKTVALFVMLAAAATAAEHTFLTAGVGLSGVVFGLFGFLWSFSTRAADDDDDDDRFHDAIDRATAICFLAWFFVCIALTLTNLLPVGNIAHAVSALLGLSIARAMTQSSRTKKEFAIIISSAMAILVVGAVVARPYLNLSPQRGQHEASLGYQALNEHRDDAAARWLRDATGLNPRVASWWFNRAIAEARLQDHDAALASYNNACRLDPANANYRVARDALQDYFAGSTRHASVSD